MKISNISKSIVRRIVDVMEESRRRGVSLELNYHAWDTRGEEAELPATDLIGLSGFTFKEDRGLWLVHCGVTISTINDDNLFREMELVDLVHDFFGETKSIALRDDTGNEVAQLFVDEFELLPAGTSEKRNYRPIGLVLMRTGGG